MVAVSLIKIDPDRIRDVTTWSFMVYYGDGSWLDILRNSGADKANFIVVCIDDPKATIRIVQLAKQEFPQAKVLARSYDRGHAMELRRAGVDFEIRETLDSALHMEAEPLLALGCAEEDVIEALEDIRVRDDDRLVLQAQCGMLAGIDTLLVPSTPEQLAEDEGRPRYLPLESKTNNDASYG